ncbi:unnamed protein product, partial [Schistosoma turkestanicum]
VCRTSEKDVVKNVNVTKSAKSDFVLFIHSSEECNSRSRLAAADVCEKDSDTD